MCRTFISNLAEILHTMSQNVVLPKCAGVCLFRILFVRYKPISKKVAKNNIVLTLKFYKKITERSNIIPRHTLLVQYVLNDGESKASISNCKLLQINIKRKRPLSLLNGRNLRNKLILNKNSHRDGKFVLYTFWNMYFCSWTRKIERATIFLKRQPDFVLCILNVHISELAPSIQDKLLLIC